MRTMQRFAVLAFALMSVASWGQTAPPRESGIYTCKDDHGKLITRDRYIAECSDREQRLLNADGSLRKVIPPTLTSDQQAQKDSKAARDREGEQALNDAIKYDRLLLRRYPDKAAHDRKREEALSDSRQAMQRAEARLRELDAERKRLLQEAEFYRGRPIPPALRQQLDNNEAAAAAQRNAIGNAQDEMDRINKKFDVELERLRKLWGDALPGSLGPPPQ
jgi:hypothetical protein